MDHLTFQFSTLNFPVLPDSSKITGFWNVMPHRLVQMHQHFEEIYRPYLKKTMVHVYQTIWCHIPEVVIITVGLKCIIMAELQAIRMSDSGVWEHLYLIQCKTRCSLFHCSSPNSMSVCITAVQETCIQNCSQRSWSENNYLADTDEKWW
jgi:hypothetical protein